MVTGGKTHHEQSSGKAIDFSAPAPTSSKPEVEPSVWPAHLQDKRLSVSDAMQVHPVAEIFPALAADVVAEFREDIKAHGINTPIVVNQARDTIIDGVNRWRIAYDLGFRFGQVPIEVFVGNDEDIPRFIIAKNALRRHLTDEQRAAIIAKVRLPVLRKEAAEERRRHLRKGDQIPVRTKSTERETSKGKVTDQLAKEADISPHKARQLDEAEKAGTLDDVISKKTKLRDATKPKESPKTKHKPKRPAKEPSFEDQVWKWFSKALKGSKFAEQNQERQVTEVLAKLLTAELERLPIKVKRSHDITAAKAKP